MRPFSRVRSPARCALPPSRPSSSLRSRPSFVDEGTPEQPVELSGGDSRARNDARHPRDPHGRGARARRGRAQLGDRLGQGLDVPLREDSPPPVVSITQGISPEEEPITGVPQSRASQSTLPNCSAQVSVVREGRASRSISRVERGHPALRTPCEARAALPEIAALDLLRSGPSPTIEQAEREVQAANRGQQVTDSLRLDQAAGEADREGFVFRLRPLGESPLRDRVGARCRSPRGAPAAEHPLAAR